MKRFNLSSEAAQDVEAVWQYIANDSTGAARRVRLRLYRAFQEPARRPRLGHRREDLTNKPLLFWPVGSYLVVYYAGVRPIQIVRVLHGARDISALLQ